MLEFVFIRMNWSWINILLQAKHRNSILRILVRMMKNIKKFIVKIYRLMRLNVICKMSGLISDLFSWRTENQKHTRCGWLQRIKPRVDGWLTRIVKDVQEGV